MSDARRKKSLALIERLARDRAREAARERAALEADHARLTAEREEVLASLVDRPALPDAAAAPYVAGWIRSVSGHADHLARTAAQTRTSIDAAADRAAEAYREATVYQHLVERIDAARAAREETAGREALAPYLTKRPGTP